MVTQDEMSDIIGTLNKQQAIDLAAMFTGEAIKTFPEMYRSRLKPFLEYLQSGWEKPEASSAAWHLASDRFCDLVFVEEPHLMNTITANLLDYVGDKSIQGHRELAMRTYRWYIEHASTKNAEIKVQLFLRYL